MVAKIIFLGHGNTINSHVLYKIRQIQQNKKHLVTFEIQASPRKPILVDNFRDEHGFYPSTTGTTKRLLHIIRKNNRGRSKDCVVCLSRKVKSGSRICLSRKVKRKAEIVVIPVRLPDLHIDDCFDRYHTVLQYKMY